MTELMVAIIADDLTGAMDAAAPFARRGALTRVVISPEYLDEVLSDRELPQVLAINTESRHLSPGQAASRVGEALKTLQRLTPQIVIKKIDSTLRGNVVAECLAARRVSARPLLIAPAVPAQGRTVQGGQVFVHGEPLAASAYGQDARSTPPVAPLHALFARQDLSVSLLSEASSIGSEDCLLDATSESDLAAIASRLLAAPSSWLTVGAAGLTEAIACARFSAQGAEAGPFGAILFAVGSRCPQALRQVEYLRSSAPDLVVMHAMVEGGTRRAVGASGLLIPEPVITSRFSAEQVAQRMADRVADMVALGEEAPVLLFLTGGDTAMAIMQRLGARQVELAGEWASGVAWGWLDGSRSRPVMTKAGGFGDDALLARLNGSSTTRG